MAADPIIEVTRTIVIRGRQSWVDKTLAHGLQVGRQYPWGGADSYVTETNRVIRGVEGASDDRKERSPYVEVK